MLQYSFLSGVYIASSVIPSNHKVEAAGMGLEGEKQTLGLTVQDRCRSAPVKVDAVI